MFEILTKRLTNRMLLVLNNQTQYYFLFNMILLCYLFIHFILFQLFYLLIFLLLINLILIFIYFYFDFSNY